MTWFHLHFKFVTLVYFLEDLELGQIQIQIIELAKLVIRPDSRILNEMLESKQAIK